MKTSEKLSRSADRLWSGKFLNFQKSLNFLELRWNVSRRFVFSVNIDFRKPQSCGKYYFQLVISHRLKRQKAFEFDVKNRIERIFSWTMFRWAASWPMFPPCTFYQCCVDGEGAYIAERWSRRKKVNNCPNKWLIKTKGVIAISPNHRLISLYWSHAGRSACGVEKFDCSIYEAILFPPIVPSENVNHGRARRKISQMWRGSREA